MAPRDRKSFPPFAEKLRTKGQSDVQRRQAQHAVELYYKVVSSRLSDDQPQSATVPNPYPLQPAIAELPVRSMATGQRLPVKVDAPARNTLASPTRNSETNGTGTKRQIWILDR